MFGYIYLITDTTNGKQYVGQHKYDKAELDPTYHGSGSIIKRIYNKRPETLEYKLLITADSIDVLNFYERFFIKHLNTLVPNGYNIKTGGDFHEITDEAKEKMSAAKIGKPSKYRGIPRPKEVVEKMKTKLTKFRFKYEDLYHLYIEDDLPAHKIAEIYGCCTATITHNLINHCIKKQPVDISFDNLYNSYVNENHSINQCAYLFNCSRNRIMVLLRKYKIKKII